MGGSHAGSGYNKTAGVANLRFGVILDESLPNVCRLVPAKIAKPPTFTKLLCTEIHCVGNVDFPAG